jgi:hypothetical protein
MDILFRRETEDDLKVAADAAVFDGVDLITGPDGKLGIVAIHNDRRVCQQCGGIFIHGHRKLEMVPVYLYAEAPPVYLHAKCQVPPMKIFTFFKGLATRRRVANIVKQTVGVAAAAEANGKTIL